MGLGKTIQSITFLYEIFNMGIRGPFLIIAPLSTITNWEREFRTWTNMNVIVYHGSQISRQMILQYEMFYKDRQVPPPPTSGQMKILLTETWLCCSCPSLDSLTDILQSIICIRYESDDESCGAPRRPLPSLTC